MMFVRIYFVISLFIVKSPLDLNGTLAVVSPKGILVFLPIMITTGHVNEILYK